jgi:hypothetical protein
MVAVSKGGSSGGVWAAVPSNALIRMMAATSESLVPNRSSFASKDGILFIFAFVF